MDKEKKQLELFVLEKQVNKLESSDRRATAQKINAKRAGIKK
jgi:hypothetical protein